MCWQNEPCCDYRDFSSASKASPRRSFSYEHAEYEGAITPIAITCKIHGVFWQVPYNHTQGVGCPKCSGNIKRTTEEFILEAEKLHCDEEGLPAYTYENVDYHDCRSDVKITCRQHGPFYQWPSSHLTGNGCPDCGNNSKVKKRLREEAEAAKEAKKNANPTEWWNLTHGEKSQKFVSESVMIESLKKVYQTDFSKVKLPKMERLELDAFSPSLQLAAEYQGLQHYEYVPFFHNSREDLVKQQERDKKKVLLCKRYGIYLIQVPYVYDYRIPEAMESYIAREVQKFCNATGRIYPMERQNLTLQQDIRSFF